MRVALIAHLLSFRASYRAAGVSEYVRHLADELPAAAGRLPDDRFTMFTSARDVPADYRPPGWEIATTPLPTAHPAARIAWEQALAPLELARRGVDVVHGPGWAVPLASRTPSVVTLHDLSFYLFPHLFGQFNRLYLGLIARLSCRRAAAVIAVSEATARDAERLLGVPRARLRVVHNGVAARFRPLPPDEVAAFRLARGLPDRFILHLGTLEPRKNLATLIRAFARLRRERSVPHKLVLAGGRGWLYDELFRLVDSLGLRDEVLFTGFISGDEKPRWYNAAAVFSYPSLYEGFGLPPLEAMACGIPVVASDTSSLPEVVGDAGIMVPPRDEAALANALWVALSDEGRHAEMVARGRERAAALTWERAAAATLAVYREAAR